jgi:hemerythrin-like domain-containing protein
MDPDVAQLREEHAAFDDHLTAMRRAATTIVTDDGADPRPLADAALDFLVYAVQPHAAAEDETFYPIVERAFGSTGTTALLLADHRTIDRLTEELHELARQLPHSIDRMVRVQMSGLLVEIDTSLRQHLAKEELVVFPLLDRILTADGRREVLVRQANFTAMHRAAASLATDPEPTEG